MAIAIVIVVLLVGFASLMTWGLFVAAKLPSSLRGFRFTTAKVGDAGTRILISAMVIVTYLKNRFALLWTAAVTCILGPAWG